MRFFERLARLGDRRFDVVLDHSGELGARQDFVQLQALARALDVGLGAHFDFRGQADFHLFCEVAQLRHGDAILCDIGVVTVTQAVHPMQHDAVIEIVAAQIGVAAGGENLSVVAGDRKNRDVERAAAQIVDQPAFRGRKVSSAGDRRSRLQVGKPAAVGSLMIRVTFRPTRSPAVKVARRCGSLNHAGTVMTASSTTSPVWSCA